MLSTTNALGGQNYFLGVAYIVVGSICLVIGLVFAVFYMSKRNKDQKNKKRGEEPNMQAK